MKLTIDQIKDITTGASKITYENGKYQFFRFNDDETEVIDNPNVVATAGIQMNFKTDARTLKLKVHTKEVTPIRSYFSFDIFVEDTLVSCIQNMDDDACIGDYANKTYSLGSFYKEIPLEAGEKSVKIIFPHSAITYIEEIELVDVTYIVPVKKDKTIIFYGDSITQGYDSLHPSKSYASRLADALDAEVINKSLGGAVFDPRLVEASSITNPDYIVVAYGTNDWNMVDLDTFRKNAKGFSYAIQKIYPGIPKYVITPLWRPDWQTTKQCGAFNVLEDTIKEFFENQENITVVSGFDLIPHDENIFGDLFLHPSDDGFEHYFKNLLKYFIK